MKLLLDTDIGSDIDDAVCLAYLLSRSDCDLMGITTVTGQSERRAMIASAVCRAAGRAVPIYPGSAQPLLIPQYQTEAPQAAVAARYPHEHSFPTNEAIGFLRDKIRRYPGEITLLSIGPLTNIGLLFALDPEIPDLLKQHVLMGGVYGPPPSNYSETEWNLSGDPHASAIVFQRGAPVTRAVGLDVTAELWMDAETMERRFMGKLLSLVQEIGAESVRRWGGMVFHDPLAAATIFAPELCRYERGHIAVDTCRPTPGKARFSLNADGPHEIAVAVDREAFFEHFFQQFASL